MRNRKKPIRKTMLDAEFTGRKPGPADARTPEDEQRALEKFKSLMEKYGGKLKFAGCDDQGVACPQCTRPPML